MAGQHPYVYGRQGTLRRLCGLNLEFVCLSPSQGGDWEGRSEDGLSGPPRGLASVDWSIDQRIKEGRDPGASATLPPLRWLVKWSASQRLLSDFERRLPAGCLQQPPPLPGTDPLLCPGTPGLGLLDLDDVLPPPLMVPVIKAEAPWQSHAGHTAQPWEKAAGLLGPCNPLDASHTCTSTAWLDSPIEPKQGYASSGSLFDVDATLFLPALDAHVQPVYAGGSSPQPLPRPRSSCTQDLLDEVLDLTLPRDSSKVCSAPAFQPVLAAAPSARLGTLPSERPDMEVFGMPSIPGTPSMLPHRAPPSRGRKSCRRTRRALSSDSDSGSDACVPARRRKHHKAWMPQETEALLEGVEACGQGSWAAIKRLGNPGLAKRSSVDLKDKWRNLRRAASVSSHHRDRAATSGPIQRTRNILERGRAEVLDQLGAPV